jgi:hypothetical protein
MADTQLQQIQKLLLKMDEPNVNEILVDTISIIDPDFNLIAKISDEKFLDFQIKFINMLPQNLFNKFMMTQRKMLSAKILNLLSTEKLSLWYNEEGVSHVKCDEINLIVVITSKNLFKDPKFPTTALKNFLASCCGNYSGSITHYEAIDLFLMMYANEVEIAPDTITDIKISRIVIKYFQNKAKMLQLECDTKEACIKEFESNRT